jgi:sterol desaturase/sphingolipid hydroxylase (fatty acid hydroxylase superfamily)
MNLPFLLRVTSYVGVLTAMLFCEWRSPFVSSEQRKPFRVTFHLGLSVGNSMILYLIMAGPTYAAVLYTQKHGIGIAHLLGLSGAVEIIAAVIALDFWDYWMHLINHKIKFLWRFHKAHHSDMEVDVTTASRFHIGELLISGSVKCLMIFVWGPSLWGLIVFEALLTGFSQFHHSNVNIPLSIQDNIEKIIVTPRMHRCHHALHENCFNTNFATIFSFWDRLFKSYHWAKEKPELQPIGVFSPRGPATMKLVPFMMTPLK